MTTRFYNYPLSISVLLKIVPWSIIFLFLATTFLLIGASLNGRVQFKCGFAELGEILQLTLGLIGSVWFHLAVIHYYSNIGINEHGLQVQFMWRYITIPWTEIIAVEEGWFGFGGKRGIRVKARRITWLHYFYGITRPAVIISSNIDNYGELVREIRSHVNGK